MAYPPALNPDYGQGAFRRALRLDVGRGQVLVELEDANHAFRLRLAHDGQQVTAVAADTHRHPFVTCSEAVGPLGTLVGSPLDADAGRLRTTFPQGANCTHLHDMALLALAHAREVGLQRHYEVTVLDERDGLTEARIACDGETVHDWAIRAHAVEAPANHAGQPMMRGFYAWVAEAYAGMALEAAVALQRGYFVAQSRRYRNRPALAYPAKVNNMPDGTCYSYNHAVVERALRIEGTVWDLTHRRDHLLQFRAQPG
jgi:hypothetical protein